MGTSLPASSLVQTWQGEGYFLWHFPSPPALPPSFGGSLVLPEVAPSPQQVLQGCWGVVLGQRPLKLGRGGEQMLPTLQWGHQGHLGTQCPLPLPHWPHVAAGGHLCQHCQSMSRAREQLSLTELDVIACVLGMRMSCAATGSSCACTNTLCRGGINTLGL